MRVSFTAKSLRWETIFDVSKRQAELDELERQSASQDLWNDPERAQQLLQKVSRLKENLAPIKDLQLKSADVVELIELAVNDADGNSLIGEIAGNIERLQAEFDRYEMQTLLSGEHDPANAILEINAGAGGTESCDWAQMLLRMYLRWTQEHGFESEIIDETPGDVAGIKSASVLIRGANAYGYLQSEIGVHRLVRISPFDANKRRHTSFASVDVVPEVAETEEVDIAPNEIRVDTYRSSGAGGQHVNKTDSAVRITHLPTGIVVTCQNERSQHMNRALAMKILQARLLERERREKADKMAAMRGEQRAIEWGSQIRSYVFQPYTMIKDHRTDYETGDVIRTMDGVIDPFIHSFLKWQGKKKWVSS